MKLMQGEYKLESGLNSIGTDGMRRRFLGNVLSNLGYVFAQIATFMWLTPFLIGYLGVAAFGIISLANIIVSYMSILTTALYSAVSRFLAIDLEQRDAIAANKTFNTALFAVVGAFVGLLPLILVASLYFPDLFNVPSGWERDGSFLFGVLTVAFFVAVAGSIFGISAFVHSLFALSSVAYAAGLLVRIGLIWVLFFIFPAHLWFVGGGVLAGSAVSLFGLVWLWRRLTPELQIRAAAFDRSRLRELMGMGGWIVVNMVGYTLLGRVDLIVVSSFFGAAMTGGYAAVAQFSTLMEYLVNAAAQVIRPAILIKYAQGDFIALQHLTSQGIKLLGLALALPAGLLCGFSRPLLSIWLGASFGDLSILLVIIISHLSLNLSARPLVDVQNAFNKVRNPGIATLISGGVNLGLAILFAAWGGWGPAGVAIACAIAWTAKNGLYMPVYTARIMKLSWWTFFPSLSASLAGTFFVGMISYAFALTLMPDSWFSLGGCAVVVALIYMGGLWAVGLSAADCKLLKDLLPESAIRFFNAFSWR
jgi:O-antigen/teichoic acid export membrane protein